MPLCPQWDSQHNDTPMRTGSQEDDNNRAHQSGYNQSGQAANINASGRAGAYPKSAGMIGKVHDRACQIGGNNVQGTRPMHRKELKVWKHTELQKDPTEKAG
jgi:hypothetical protein